MQQAAIVERTPSPYFTSFLASMLSRVGHWRSAENLAQWAVIPCGHFIQPEQLDGILTAWAENPRCREAGDMPEHAWFLWTQAPQLQTHPAWAAFVKRVRELAPKPELYQYDELAKAIGYE